MSGHIHPTTGQPIGAPVNDQPVLRPGAVTLAGRYGRVEKLAPAHAATLWDAVRGHDSIWTYMSQYDHSRTPRNFQRGWRNAPRWMILMPTPLSIRQIVHSALRR
ncbi:MAG TPA: hypothetical protein VKP52_14085 [Pseudolabrys sp.]|nr:hypothetical protein [Pseudolabrys sp.]